MDKSDKFEDICKRLDNKENIDGEIDFVKLYLVNEINGNRDVYLKIKAECEDSDIYAYASITVAMAAVIISLYSMVLTSIIEKIEYEELKIIITLLVILISCFYSIFSFSKVVKKKHIAKWRKYIKVVLEDMDKNWEDYFRQTKV